MARRERDRLDRDRRERRIDRVDKIERVNHVDRVEKNYYGYGHIGYFLGVIGAAVYFIQQATTPWLIVLGILKAIVWPAYAVYGLLKIMGVA